MSKDIEDDIEEKGQENEKVISETKEYTEEFDDEIEEKAQENEDVAKEYTVEELAEMKDIEGENEEKGQENEDVLSETKEYTEGDLADMKEKFMMFDDDGGGGLTSNELEKLLQYMGHNPTLKEVDEIIASVDADNTGEIEFDEFVDLMQKIENSQLSIGRTKEQIAEAFDILEVKDDEGGKGYILLNTLRRVLTTLGEKMSEEEVDAFIEDMDLKESSQITKEQFLNAFDITR